MFHFNHTVCWEQTNKMSEVMSFCSSIWWSVSVPYYPPVAMSCKYSSFCLNDTDLNLKKPNQNRNYLYSFLHMPNLSIVARLLPFLARRISCLTELISARFSLVDRDFWSYNITARTGSDYYLVIIADTEF